MSDTPTYKPNWISRLLEGAGALWRASERWLPANYIRVIGGLGVVLAIPWAMVIVLLFGNVLDLLRTPVEEDYRPTAYALGVSLTALAGLIAAPLVIVRTYVNERQAKTAERGHITDRFSKAIEQLGSDQMAVRLGAIYALEQVARDEVTYHIPIMETLCAFIRENANRDPEPDKDGKPGKMRALKEFPLGPLPWPIGHVSDEERALHLDHIRCRGWEGGNLREFFGPARPLRADVQAAFAVIGRRDKDRRAHEQEEEFRLDFRRANFQSLDLSHLDLARANLRESRMEGADLSSARMEGANLSWARMERANLSGARMEGADLSSAWMEGANLFEARMEGANLMVARMEGANLFEARMEGANLFEARMEGVIYSEVP